MTINQHPSVPMTEVITLAKQITTNPDYNLDEYGLDIKAVVDVAMDEQCPPHYNELDRENLALELRSQYEEIYQHLTEWCN